VEEGGSNGNTPGYKFTGKELDPETGLYYFGARYYDAVLSRWISADPILGKYLPSGDREKNNDLPGMGGVFESKNLSLYDYSHSNPITLLDPDGNDVVVPVAMKLSNFKNLSHYRNEGNPYVIYKFNVYSYKTIEAYDNAVATNSLSKPVGQVELTLEVRSTDGNKGTILGPETRWAEMYNAPLQLSANGRNHDIAITDVGSGVGDISYAQVTSPYSDIIGYNRADIFFGQRVAVRAHAGGPYGSTGCPTSPTVKNKAAFVKELKKQIPSLTKSDERTFILLKKLEPIDNFKR